MTDPRARRGVADRWLLPPAPRDPEPAARWEALPFERRRTLARTGPRDVATLDPPDAELVASLARARLATSWRLLAAAPLLGWLMLMTMWGFGRSAFPTHASSWLLGAVALGALTWLGAAIAVAARLRRARQVLAATASDAAPPT